METRETFIITLFRDPQRSKQPRGRVRHVASGREATFQALVDLLDVLPALMDDRLTPQGRHTSSDAGQSNATVGQSPFEAR